MHNENDTFSFIIRRYSTYWDFSCDNGSIACYTRRRRWRRHGDEWNIRKRIRWYYYELRCMGRKAERPQVASDSGNNYVIVATIYPSCKRWMCRKWKTNINFFNAMELRIRCVYVVRSHSQPMPTMMTLSSSSPISFLFFSLFIFIVHHWMAPGRLKRYTLSSIPSWFVLMWVRVRAFVVHFFLSKSHTTIASSCGKFIIRFNEMNTHCRLLCCSTVGHNLFIRSCVNFFPCGWINWKMNARSFEKPKWFLSSK